MGFYSLLGVYCLGAVLTRKRLIRLLSFAQFEREVTGERIRDKLAASKRKGLWMGGVPPLGYDIKDRKLVINEAEALIVRQISFKRRGGRKPIMLPEGSSAAAVTDDGEKAPLTGVTIPIEERIEAIGRRVAAEEADLLPAWAIEGVSRLIRQRNFTIPPSSKLALIEWMLGADPVLAWLDACVEAKPHSGGYLCRGAENCDGAAEKALQINLDDGKAAPVTGAAFLDSQFR